MSLLLAGVPRRQVITMQPPKQLNGGTATVREVISARCVGGFRWRLPAAARCNDH